MNGNINPGVWPTMIALFDKDGRLDIDANKAVAKRLIDMGCDGIFAVCQSSEMFYLSIDEKVALAKAVKETIGERISLVISGHTASEPEEQIADMERLAEVGADALVLVTNRVATNDDGFETFKANTRSILDAVPDAKFGFYECPYPFLRLLSDDELKWCADTGRIYFLKDVSCNEKIQTRRAKIVEGTKMSLYNANTETILHSLKAGYVGYNGVMGNFHIDIYEWLYTHIDDPRADMVQGWLTEQSMIERHAYPIIAKYYLQLKGYAVETVTRSKPMSMFGEDEMQRVIALESAEAEMRRMLGLPQMK